MKRRATRAWPIPAFLLSGFLLGCGGKPTVETPKAPIIEPVVDETPPAPPRYVIVHRNTPIRMTPDDDAPFLQYRTPERQAELEKRWAEDEAKRLEEEAEATTARLDKEKKRRELNRKRRRKYSKKRRAELAEKDKERAEAQRIKRAERSLSDLRKRAAKRRIEGPDRAWIPFELVAEKGGWLEISPVSRDSETPHCYARNFGEIDRLHATFWVRTGEVEEVLTRSVTIAPEHGTQVVLKPGVVVRDADVKQVVFVDGYALELAVPRDPLGTSYEPDRPFEAPMTDTVFTPIAFSEGKLKLARGMPFPPNPYRDLYVTGTLFVGSRFYVTTQTPCGEYTMAAGEELVEPVGKRGVMRLSGDEDTVKPPLARPGAMAHLPDGTPFARVRAKYPLGSQTESREGRLCFRTAVWGESDAAVSRSLELCFLTDEVQLAPAPK